MRASCVHHQAWKRAWVAGEESSNVRFFLASSQRASEESGSTSGWQSPGIILQEYLRVDWRTNTASQRKFETYLQLLRAPTMRDVELKHRATVKLKKTPASAVSWVMEF